MVDLEPLVPALVQPCLSDTEKQYLREVFERFQGYPSLRQLWQLMDEQWNALACDALVADERIHAFYGHPVWLLNGLFIEQDGPSLGYRQSFASWIIDRAPKRVADYGGGFGRLARFIGQALPQTRVDIVEPYPHQGAVALARPLDNVHYISALQGHYDLIIATDVFEHVLDPIGVALQTASHLRESGIYIMANCFSPVIQCHLPQLFHLQAGWDPAMQAMGLNPIERLQYGRVFQATGRLNEAAARRVERLARRLYPFIQRLPRGRARLGSALVGLLASP